jgi:cation:H+ antiporter
LVGYTSWLIAEARREGAAPEFDEAELTHPKAHSLPANLLWVVAGLGLLVLGSQWLVAGAVQFAEWLGVSEVVIGLTIVAAGTSLPEVATSLMAAMRGQRDIAVGNVVGSNAFNLLGVLGASGLASPGGLPVQASMIALDFPLMTAAAVACLPLFAPGRMIPRWQGWAFLAVYVAYTVYLVLDATKHEAAAGYGAAMLRFVVPLTVMTFTVIALRVLRGEKSSS